MAKYADSYLNCYDSSDKTFKKVELWTETVYDKNGSGIQFNMYNKNEDINCRGFQRIKHRYEHRYYFVDFRTFSVNNKIYSQENDVDWGRDKRRQLVIPRKSPYYNLNFEFDDNLYYVEEVDKYELPKLKTELANNVANYLRKYSNFKEKLNTILTQVRQKEADRKIALNTQEQLTEARDNKNAEMEITKQTLKDLKQQSSDLSLRVRDLDKQQNILIVNEHKPLVKKVINNKIIMKVLRAQIQNNKDKIEGIKRIDEDDLAAKLKELKNKLKMFRSTFLTLDPRYGKLSTIIDDMGPKTMLKIPYTIYN